MLRINLLPPYIYEGSTRKKVLAAWIIIILVVVGGFVYGYVTLQNQAKEWKDKAAQEEPQASEADRRQANADKINQENAALKAKVDFVSGANSYNRDTYPKVFDNVRDYTISRVLYSSVVPANQTVTISAYAPSLTDVGHYMLAMEKDPQITNVSVAMNSIPGFPQTGGGQAQRQAGGMMGPMGPMGPGMSGPGMSGAAMGGPKSMGPMSMSPGSMGPMSMGPRGGGSMGMGAMGGGQTQAAGARPPGGAGHDFTVTLSLAKEIPAGPVYPAGWSGGQSGGGGFGMGGRMGGMGGPMMSGMSMGGGPPMMSGPPGGGGSGAMMGGGSGR